MYCSNCGTELTDDAKFCASCGSPVTAHEVPANAGAQPDKSNKVYYDDQSGIIVDSKVYNQNGSIYPINQISSVEILKNPIITQQAVLLYGLGAFCVFAFLGTGNFLWLIGLLAPVLEYRSFRRIRWLQLRTGGTSERALVARSQDEREELHKIKEAILLSISENS